jgi:hypothetical protein
MASGQPVGALAVDHTDGPALLGGQVGQALGGGGLACAWEADEQGGQAQLPGRGTTVSRWVIPFSWQMRSNTTSAGRGLPKRPVNSGPLSS